MLILVGSYQSVAFSSHHQNLISIRRSSLKLFSSTSDIIHESQPFTRRNLLQSGIAVMGVLMTASPSLAAVTESVTKDQKILVLGGTGLVGSEVCKILTQLQIPFIATSRDGRENTIALDFTPGSSSSSQESVEKQIQALAKGCTAVISTVGAIGTPYDNVVNAASGLAAQASKAAGVNRFVYVSVSPQVRDSTKDLHLLDSYMQGKIFSEDAIKSSFDSSSYTIVQPTFIYGGNQFGINPPRVNEQYGSLVETLLSSGPFRTLAQITPGLISVALQPPISAHAVAGACVAGALGLTRERKVVLETYDAINDASKLI